ncbi:MAG: hypothetical protein EOM67_01520, partial [Spirochaetia bacterium]|nr:hypothetical protein [Spirochaetia bacterium]
MCVFLKDFTDIKRICIERDVAPDQDVSFTSQTVFTETTETAIDKVTMLAQDYRIKEYTLRVPEDEVVFDGTMQLPPSNVRANKYLYFDTFGLPTAGMGPDQSKALRQGQGEETDPTFEMGFIERRNKGIIFDSDASVVLTEREKILNEHLQGGAGISVITLEGAPTTSVSAVAGNNVIVNESGISVPIAQDASLGVVMAGHNISIGAGGEINAVNTEYSAGNGIAVSEAGVISAVAGDNVTVDEDGIAVAIGTTTNLGVLKVGNNLAVTDGVISAPASTGSALGVVKAGTNTSIGAGGEINAVDTTYAAGNGLQLSTGMFSVRAHSNVVVDANGVSVPVATSSSLGVMQVGTGLSVTGGVVSASATGSIIYPFTLDKDKWTLMADKITISNSKMPWINGLIQIGKDSIAVGAYGCIAVKTGAVWDKLTPIVSTDLKSIAYGKDIIVVVGSNGVILSGTDIRSLSVVTSKTTVGLNGVCWTGTKFVAVGEGGFLANSPDGEIWTIRSSGTSETLYRVAQTSLGTVAVGSSGYVGLSTNHGDTLTAKASETSASLFGVCQGASDIIIVGANGTILTTGNLSTFSTKASGTTNALWDVCYADSKLAAVGVGASLLYSSDQNTWTKETYASSIAFYAVMYAENRWICAGSQDISSTSSLGVSLTAEEPISNTDIFDSTYGNGTYVSLQGGGKLLITTNKRNYATVQT